jgi:hypothetical protein
LRRTEIEAFVMVNERERYEGEEEYHFSDEQIDFEEEDTEPVKPTPPPSPKDNLINKMSSLTSRRRALVAGIVFIVLIGVVYNMLTPSKPGVVSVAKELTAEPPHQVVAISSPPPQIQSSKEVASKPIAPVETKPIEAQGDTLPTMASTPVNAAPVSSATPEMSARPIITNQPPSGVVSEPQVKIIVDRLATLEQQNSAMLQLLQTEYAQKIADYETQGNVMRGKIDELTKRLNRMDAALNQMVDSKQALVPPPTATPKVETKIGYSVQAIIPGRAWLKSESGDTVTVAEGDILRNYGRISKIDPYDGIVEIDTGNKTITISYGMNVE